MGTVNRALSNGERKAATVLAGSAIEAAASLGTQKRQKISQLDVTMAIRTAPNLPSAPLEEWHLPDCIEASRRLRIVTPSTATQVELARNSATSSTRAASSVTLAGETLNSRSNFHPHRAPSRQLGQKTTFRHRARGEPDGELREIEPEVLLVSCGFDAHAGIAAHNL